MMTMQIIGTAKKRPITHYTLLSAFNQCESFAQKIILSANANITPKMRHTIDITKDSPVQKSRKHPQNRAKHSQHRHNKPKDAPEDAPTPLGIPPNCNEEGIVPLP